MKISFRGKNPSFIYLEEDNNGTIYNPPQCMGSTYHAAEVLEALQAGYASES